MKFKIVASMLFATLILVACSEDRINEVAVLDENDAKDIKALVHDYSVHNIEAQSASITSEQLIVVDNEDNQYIYDLSEDEFFVSIAPYIHETHPCENHSLTSCQGEMVNEQFDIYIEDTEGNIIVDEALKSKANGFIDLWLPRNQTYSIKIEHEGKIVESEFSTFENSGTCLTTMQLI